MQKIISISVRSVMWEFNCSNAFSYTIQSWIMIRNVLSRFSFYFNTKLNYCDIVASIIIHINDIDVYSFLENFNFLNFKCIVNMFLTLAVLAWKSPLSCYFYKIFSRFTQWPWVFHSHWPGVWKTVIFLN